MIKKIGVLTSGGDAPGMNAAIRGVVRAALTEGLEVMGIHDGYLGLYEDRMVQLDRYSVSDMINRGGTFLGSARFPEFRDENVRWWPGSAACRLPTGVYGSPSAQLYRSGSASAGTAP